MKRAADITVIQQLQQQILMLQGKNSLPGEHRKPLGLGELESAFPNGVFTKGAVHELISTSSEEAACTSGFIGVVLNKLLKQGGYCIWISTVPRRSIYPPAMNYFGVDPSHILFVDTTKSIDTLWALEEALKCNALVAVVGELSELGFNESRRYQLAVEQSQVTGFIHRFRPKSENAVACVTRWKISPSDIETDENIKGVGSPVWNVKLTKVRSGMPGEWTVKLNGSELEYIHPSILHDADEDNLLLG